MNRRSLWRIRVGVNPSSEDAVAELLQSIFGIPASIYTDLKKGRSWATVYLNKTSAWNPGIERNLLERLRELRRLDIPVPRIAVSVARLADEDWAESWKRHFKPLEIGRGLLLLPSWSRRKPRRDQATIVLDPGLSFGTGHHPTTRFCLEEVLKAREAGATSMVDMGCGSGILAIAAAKLGFKRVEAFDFDPAAVRIAKENFALNGMAGRVPPIRADLTKLPARPKQVSDVVAANLTADLLTGEAGRIASRVAPGGRLILAGILERQFGEVQKAFGKEGFQLIRSRVKGEWRSGLFRFA